MLTQVQMLVSGHPQPTSGHFVLMRGDPVQRPSDLGTVTASPHEAPLPSGSYVHNGGEGLDVARVWLTPTDFAALCACLATCETELTLSRSGSVVTSFSFAPVQAPLQSMSHALRALERRMNQLDPESLRAEITAIRGVLDELLRRLPEPRYSDRIRRHDDEDDEPMLLVSPSSKRVG
ncbi:MAG TPA: hypothetical protein VHC69_20250 [Polyangiaceae bacterium]|nr:hypothetical protein [Polyangiaceae bacterium]